MFTVTIFSSSNAVLSPSSHCLSCCIFNVSYSSFILFSSNLFHFVNFRWFLPLNTSNLWLCIIFLLSGRSSFGLPIFLDWFFSVTASPVNSPSLFTSGTPSQSSVDDSTVEMLTGVSSITGGVMLCLPCKTLFILSKNLLFFCLFSVCLLASFTIL